MKVVTSQHKVIRMKVCVIRYKFYKMKYCASTIKEQSQMRKRLCKNGGYDEHIFDKTWQTKQSAM